jgi:hypothetical protein
MQAVGAQVCSSVGLLKDVGAATVRHKCTVHLRARCRRQVCVAESERRDSVLQPQ